MTSSNEDRDDANSTVSGLRLGTGIIVWVVSSLSIGYATYLVLPSVFPGWAGEISRLSAVIVAEVYLLLIISFVVSFGGIGGICNRLSIGRGDADAVTLTLVVWVGAYLIALAGYGLLSTLFPPFPTITELIDHLLAIGTDMGRLDGADGATVVIVLARACVFAPIAEELLFRGALFGWLRRHLSPWATIGLTAIAFAAIHGMMIWTMVPLALVVGIAAGYARERTGSVTPVIVVHIVQNVIVVIAGVWILL